MSNITTEPKKIERKKAPSIEVEDVFRDERKALLERLDTESPDFVHSYQSPNVKQSELDRKGQEAVQEDGKPVIHGDDIVVRQSRELFERRRGLEEARSLKVAKMMAKGHEESLEQTRKPVKPKLVEK